MNCVLKKILKRLKEELFAVKMESKGMKMYVVRNEFTFAKEVNLAKITPPILFLKILENSPEKSSMKEMKINSD